MLTKCMTHMEEWRNIEGFEGLYQVSNQGRIKNLDYRHTGKEKILKPRKDGRGYYQVILYKNGKTREFRVHRLVAKAFIPNLNNWPQVNHRDEDKTNNCVENLEWCDRKYNCNYGTRNERVAEKLRNGKLSIPVIARVIATGEVELYPSTQEAGRQLNYHPGNISYALIGKYRTACGRTWKYA